MLFIVITILDLFTWINEPDDFSLKLQNDWIQDQVVGVEKFTDGEPLTLQLQVLSSIHHGRPYIILMIVYINVAS